MRYIVTSSNRLAMTLNQALLLLVFQRMLILGRPSLGRAKLLNQRMVRFAVTFLDRLAMSYQALLLLRV